MGMVKFKARMKTSEFKSSVLFTEATIWPRGCRQEFQGLIYPFGKYCGFWGRQSPISERYKCWSHPRALIGLRALIFANKMEEKGCRHLWRERRPGKAWVVKWSQGNQLTNSGPWSVKVTQEFTPRAGLGIAQRRY